MTVAIRPRGPWEAIDLGFGMLRRFLRPVTAAWLCTVTPAWLLVALLLARRPGLTALVFWWLRPLLDRVVLHVLSRALFGEVVSARATLATLPRLLSRYLVSALVVFRLDPARSFNLPVWQLEGLRGGERWRRSTVLGRDGHAPAVWLTCACAAFEAGTALALLALAAIAVPGLDGEELFRSLLEGRHPYALVLVSFLAFALVEPFYVAAGFSLYLNRRTRLEGWDVEIALRRLASRLAAPGRAAALALLLAAVLLPSIPALADPPAGANADKRPEEVVRDVLAGADFQTHRKIKTLRFKGARKKPQEERSLGRLGATAPLVALAVFLALLLWHNRAHLRPAVAAAERAEAAPPPPVAGTRPRGERLPANPGATALALLERGDAAGALSLLYRASIAASSRGQALESANWTEGDWLDFVSRKAGPAESRYFRTLVAAWSAAAYAHRPPPPAEVRALCVGLPRGLGAA
jgi:hypothetical protein